MKTVQLTADLFKKEIFDYTQSKEWKYKGSLPGIIDFYADWCGPCKMIAPILDDLAKEFDGEITIYKVDTEVEQELSAIFGIKSIPSLLFMPKDKQPMMQAGALPKDTLKQLINKELITSE